MNQTTTFPDRLPTSWNRILDALTRAGRPLPALEIHRRLHPMAEATRVPPELAARLADLRDAGVLIRNEAGWRPAEPPDQSQRV